MISSTLCEATLAATYTTAIQGISDHDVGNRVGFYVDVGRHHR